METIEIYVADDGTRFDDYDECAKYEARKLNDGSALFFDEKYKEIRIDTDWSELDGCSFVYIRDAKGANETFSWLEDYYGYIFPEECEDGEVFAYDWDKGEWYSPAKRAAKYALMLENIAIEVNMRELFEEGGE